MFRHNQLLGSDHRATKSTRRALLLTILAVAAGCGVSDPVAVEVVVCDGFVGPDCAVGSLSLVVSGLPTDIQADIAVSGPSGLTHSVRETMTLTDLLPGEYTITATAVATDDAIYGPGAPTQTAFVTVSESAETLVSYSVITGGQSGPGSP